MAQLKSWQPGYINKYKQLTLRYRPRRPGRSGYSLMHCLVCGETHGTRAAMWRRRCTNPHCEFGGGQPGQRLSPDERAETSAGRRVQALRALAMALAEQA